MAAGRQNDPHPTYQTLTSGGTPKPEQETTSPRREMFREEKQNITQIRKTGWRPGRSALQDAPKQIKASPGQADVAQKTNIVTLGTVEMEVPNA